MDCFQFRSSPCAPTAASIIATTSACDIGFGAVAPPDAAGAVADGAAAGGATGAAGGALERPKIADTMLPKMLIFASSTMLPSCAAMRLKPSARLPQIGTG